MQKINKNNYYSSVIAIVVGLIALYFIFKIGVWILIVSLFLGLIAILIPWVAKIIHLIWTYIGKSLNFIVSPIVLSLIFFLILSPLALLRKLFEKTEQIHSTNFKSINKKYIKSDFEKLW